MNPRVTLFLLACALSLAPACGGTVSAPTSPTTTSCDLTLAPASQTVAPDGGSFHTRVSGGCAWKATTDENWIAVTYGEGSSLGTVTYTVAANDGDGARAGRVRIGEEVLHVVQEGRPAELPAPSPAPAPEPPTAPAPTPPSAPAPPAPAPPAPAPPAPAPPAPAPPAPAPPAPAPPAPAPPAPAPPAPAPPAPAPPAPAPPAPPAPPTPPPAPTCKYEVGPSSQSVTAKGGEFSITVTTADDCKWSASSSPSWIAIRSGSGAGEGRVTYVVSSNEGSARTGKIEVGGTTVTISQEAMPRPEPTCTVSLSPSSQSVPLEGGGFSIKVSVDARCSWSVEKGVSWIIVKSGSGTGPGEIAYGVERNSGPARSAAIVVSGQGVKVSQTGVK